MRTLAEWAKMVVLEGDLSAKLTPPPILLIRRVNSPFETSLEHPEAPNRSEPTEQSNDLGSDSHSSDGIIGAKPLEYSPNHLPERPKREGIFPREKNTPKTHPDALLSIDDRARLLHSFANHELLALEIMALMLLKFPHMPLPFQASILQTVRDEQKHFSLYRERLMQLGYDFGSFGINYYLWDMCARSSSPLEYLVQMALTFEQANLDFALFYEKKFRDSADEKSAEIMKTVYRDEISHVHTGLKWFEKWRPKQESLWDTYRKLLPPPLTPARAKGFFFNGDIRQKIGFDREFVHELQFFTHSKGRPPNVLWFNPEVEAELENGNHSYQPAPVFTDLNRDFALHLAYLAKKDDIVCVPEKPSENFLKTLDLLGFAQPEFVTTASIPTKLCGRKLGKFMPWGISNRSIRIATNWSLDLEIPEFLPQIHPLVSRKSWAKKILELYLAESHKGTETNLDFFGGIFHSEDQLTASLEKLAPNHKNIVVKSDFSCSGRGHKKFSTKIAPSAYSPQEKGWIRKHLKRDGVMTVEPWLSKIADFSIQIQVESNDQRSEYSDKTSEQICKIIGITRFWTDHLGHYNGHILGDLFDGLPQNFKRWYHESHQHQELLKIAKFVGKKLSDLGYRGPAGIDVLFYQTADQFDLYPIVEINPRFTMGRIALALNKRISKKTRCRWVHLQSEQIVKELVKNLGNPNNLQISPITQLINFLNKDIPIQAPLKSPLENGAIATSDISSPHRSMSLILSGFALERFERIGLLPLKT